MCVEEIGICALTGTGCAGMWATRTSDSTKWKIDSMRLLPSIPEISRETLAVIAGASSAAAFVAAVPDQRKWVSDRLPTAGRDRMIAHASEGHDHENRV